MLEDGVSGELGEERAGLCLIAIDSSGAVPFNLSPPLFSFRFAVNLSCMEWLRSRAEWEWPSGGWMEKTTQRCTNEHEGLDDASTPRPRPLKIDLSLMALSNFIYLYAF